ncbi:VOC family protein [Actomonas aquatica]|uniref:VOC family protein n=1 Tax=Actomonas aquatica TaxID=2866162 RepID=A0ABZ1C3U8_9BACT|nr:VOC family protein [Opitutus sp. WL0086]WRQ85968.1 VOC family protein [Opitutus sp. WL0086]
MTLVTTLNFSGRTAEALAFYQEALDAEVLFLLRFAESPLPPAAREGLDDLVFHATFRIADTVLMASDVGHTPGQAAVSFSGFSLALRLQSVERAQSFFAALRKGGEVVIPLARSEFTSWYGIVIDRFGISWKLNVDEAENA